MSSQYILIYAGMSVQLIAILIGFYFWNKGSGLHKKVMAMLVTTFLLQIAADLVGRAFGNSMWVIHFTCILEFLFFLSIFKDTLLELYKVSILKLIFVLFLGFSVLNIITFQKLNEFPSYTRFAESVLVIFFCVSYFILLLKKLKPQVLYHTFMFWFSSGILLFFASNLLIYLFSSFLLKSAENEINEAIWIIHNCINIILYLSIITAFLQLRRNSTASLAH